VSPMAVKNRGEFNKLLRTRDLLPSLVEWPSEVHAGDFGNARYLGNTIIIYVFILL